MLKKLGNQVLSRVENAVRSEQGASIIEYIVLCAVIVVGAIVLMNNLTNKINGKVQDILDAIDTTPTI